MLRAFTSIRAFKSALCIQELRLAVWRKDCIRGSVRGRKTKTAKETHENGKSKAGEKGKEARNNQAVAALQAIDQVLTL
jgi:hypothetical protein